MYAPPLVADLHPAPGLEVVISDSDVRKLRCVGSDGRRLWEFTGGWKKRLASAAALSFTAGRGAALILIGNPDGLLCCVEGATGRERWRYGTGPVEWGGALWADLDGDGGDEAIAGTAGGKITALTADGQSLWIFAAEPVAGALDCPLAASDIDGDGRSEVFGVGVWGPFCVGGDGTLRWFTGTSDRFVGAPVIADADGDGNPELYCTAESDSAVLCFDAVSGELRWRAPLMGPADVYSGSSLALGDLNGDGRDEILAGDSRGHVHCLAANGNLLWTYLTEKRTHAAPSIGDVDGDGDIETLVACGDHFLYCLNSWGELEWRFEAQLRLIHPATIADVDGDGKTDILFGGSDGVLRCLSLGGRYDPHRIPWPSRRFDAAQSGACFRERQKARQTTFETISLFSHGGFELEKPVGTAEEYPKDSDLHEMAKGRPQGWHAESVGAGFSWTLDPEMKAGGSFSLKVMSEADPTTIATEAVGVARELRSLTASVLASPQNPGKAFLRWSGRDGVMRTDPLEPSERPAVPKGWVLLQCRDAVPPWSARWVALVCVSQPGTTWWDEAELTGVFEHAVSLRALVNQVGYDIGAPKRFTAQSNFVAEHARFELVREDGSTAYSAPLEAAGRITGAYGHDWGCYYWRGDFSEFNEPGRYRIHAALGDLADTSWPFQIAENLLWTQTARPAYRFFYYQRCGAAVPRFHEACHLDDAASPDGTRHYELWGGWHDAGDYNTYDNAPYVYRLACAYTNAKARFDEQDEDNNGASDFLDEILWGADHAVRTVASDGSAYGPITSGYGFWGPPELETDNIPGTGDERRISGAETGNDSSYHAAALARVARHVKDNQCFVEAAERALKWALDNGKRGPLQLSAALDLFAATANPEYERLARELFPQGEAEGLTTKIAAYLTAGGLEAVEAIRGYDAAFGQDHTEAIRIYLVEQAETMLDLAQNPFGILTHGPKDPPNFFGTPRDAGGWHVGTNSFLLNAAATMALAHEYIPDPRYCRFVYDQFNWILGNNPYDISLMEGVGSANPPTYHQRLAFAGVPRGAIPGSVVNGITWRDVGDDRPFLDMSGLDIPAYESNEVWLPHNTAYLAALVNVRRGQVANPRPP